MALVEAVLNNENILEKPEILDITDASKMLRLSKQTIYGLTSRREIPHYRKNKKLYFLRSELKNWMLERPKQKRYYSQGGCMDHTTVLTGHPTKVPKLMTTESKKPIFDPRCRPK